MPRVDANIAKYYATTAEADRLAPRRGQQKPLASYAVGDARGLEFATAAADAILFLGPLYHLTDGKDRATTAYFHRPDEALEGESSLVGISAHLLVVARKP